MAKLSFQEIIDGNYDLSVLKDFFDTISQEDRPNIPVYCIRLQKLDNAEFQKFGIEIAKKLTEEEILISLVPILATKSSYSQKVRDLSGVLLNRISSENLSDKLSDLIQVVRAPYFLVRAEAKRLLEKIESKDLKRHFGDLQTLVCDSDKEVQKISITLILKIAGTWSVDEKIKHYDFFIKLKSQINCRKAQEACDLLSLQVMTTWETEKLKPHLSFLMQCTGIETFEISEIAAGLALKVFLASDSATRIVHINYLASFNQHGSKILRRNFRHLALLTIKEMDKEYISSFVLFLLQCLEGKSRKDRKMAWQCLSQIDPNSLPIEELIYCQTCSLYRVRRASKKLAFRISKERLAENLKLFLDVQSSGVKHVRNLAYWLVASIPVVRLREEKNLIEHYRATRCPYTRDMIENLLSF